MCTAAGTCLVYDGVVLPLASEVSVLHALPPGVEACGSLPLTLGADGVSGQFLKSPVYVRPGYSWPYFGPFDAMLLAWLHALHRHFSFARCQSLVSPIEFPLTVALAPVHRAACPRPYSLAGSSSPDCAALGLARPLPPCTGIVVPCLPSAESVSITADIQCSVGWKGNTAWRRHELDVVAPAGAMMSSPAFWVGLVDHIATFVRSFLLIQLLAFCRLLVFATPLPRQARRTRSVIQRARLSLRGAPLIFAVACAIPFAQAMPSSSHQGAIAGSAAACPGDSSSSAPCFPGEHGVSFADSPAGPAAAPVGLPASDTPVAGTVAVAAGDPVAADAGQAPWHFPVIGLRYQQPHVWAPAHSLRHSTLDDLFEHAEATFCVDIPACHIVEVYPQPYLPYPVFLISLPWTTQADFVPICLQVYRQGGYPLVSCEYVAEMSFHCELLELLPLHFQAGVEFFIGDRTAPVDPGDTIRLCPGILVRAFPAGLNPRRPITLCHRLERMWEQFNDVEVDGEPWPDCSRFVAGVLMPAGVPSAFATLEGDADDIHLAIARHLHRPVSSFQVVVPHGTFEEVAVNGMPVSRLFGVLPPDIGQLVPVFVDPREAAQHFRIVLLPPVPLTFRDFITAANVRVPDGYEAHLEGVTTPQPHWPRIVFRPASVICVSVRVLPVEPPTEAALPLHEGIDGADADRERSPRRGGCSHPGPFGPSSSGGPVPDVYASDGRSHGKWSRGFPCTTTLPARRPEDTSALCTVRPRARPTYQTELLCALAISRLCREDCLLQCITTQCETCPVVFNELEPPPPLPPDGPPSPALVSQDSTSSPATPGEWRVLACVLRYQTEPEFRLLWVAEGESVRSFVSRSVVVLRSAFSDEDVVLAEPSPIHGAVVFVAAPRWWALVPQSVCVVAWLGPEDGRMSVFADVACTDTTLYDFMHEVPVEAGLALDVHLSSDTLPARPDQPYFPALGDIVTILPEGRALETRPTSHTLISDPAFAVTDADLPPRPTVADSWLVLGPYSEQVLLRRDARAADCQLSEALGIQAEDLVVHHCRFPFLNAAVRDVPVGHFVSVRTRRVFGQPEDGKLVYFDPRDLGLPFSTCVFPERQRRLSSAQVYERLDFAQVDGFQLIVWRNGSRSPVPLPFAFDHGDAITVRLSPVGPSPPPTGLRDHHDDAAWREPSSSSSDADDCPTTGGRSRSPRRCTTALASADPAPPPHTHCDAGRGPCPTGGDACDLPAGPEPCVPGLFDRPVFASRPIPTPCRALCMQPRVSARLEVELHIDQLTTVLECAVRSDAHVCKPVVDHWVSCASSGVSHVRPGTPGRSDALPSVLCISDHVGPVAFDLTMQQLPLGRDLGAAIELLRPWPFELHHSFPPDLVLHASTLCALAQAVPFFRLPL